MPNLAATLKEEIRRLARKEIKSQINATRRATIAHRREIATLRRQLAMQQRKIAALNVQVADRPVKSAEDQEGIPIGSRFSSRSVRAQRRRLKLSALEFGKLVGVSAQTVYHWEQGKARPRRSQFAALIAVRDMGRREALKHLETAPDVAQESETEGEE